MPTRLGSAMPSATRYFTPHVRSSCILRPHSPLPAFRNSCRIRWSRGSSASARHSRDWRRTAPARCSPRHRAPRTAVRDHQGGQILGRHSFRQREICGDFQAVG